MKVSKCKYENSKARYRLTGSTYIYRNLNVMHNILISRGPIIAYISGLLSSFQFYASGVYNDRNCPNDFSKLNHVVLIVGYGTDNQTGENYWLAKNSWGDKWGEVIQFFEAFFYFKWFSVSFFRTVMLELHEELICAELKY